MRIAVNARFLASAQLEGYEYFTKEIFFRLAHQHPEHEFIFLFDRDIPGSLQLPSNVAAVVVKPAARHALGFRWWFDVKVPLALRRYKADVFVSPDGFCSLFTKVPQVLVVHDLAFLHYPKFIQKHQLYFYKRYTPKFLKKANIVATISQYSKQDIMKHYNLAESKIINVGSAAKEIFKPIDSQQREIVKEQYAGGNEYFVFVGGMHPRKNLLNLLKAFSIFKKWQKTNMKLVVAGRKSWMYEDTLEKLKTYKYRNEVIMLDYLPEDELAKVVAAAYALVYPSFFEGFGVPILEAMQCDVPVLTSSSGSMPAIGADAALYADPSSPQEIADNMKRIFKDEKLRSELIEKGRERAAVYSWNRTAELMWSAIEKAVNK
jgi:glycosyltransferase involved in cell wall biosynthesis